MRSCRDASSCWAERPRLSSEETFDSNAMTGRSFHFEFVNRRVERLALNAQFRLDDRSAMVVRLCGPVPKQPADGEADSGGHEEADQHLTDESDHHPFVSSTRSSMRRLR